MSKAFAAIGWAIAEIDPAVITHCVVELPGAVARSDGPRSRRAAPMDQELRHPGIAA